MFDGSFGLRVMTRPGGELSIPHGAKLTAQGLLGDADAELLPHPPAQIDKPPAHDAMNRRDRTALDHRRQCRTVRVVQFRLLARRLAINQAVRTMGIELQHPCDRTSPGKENGM